MQTLVSATALLERERVPNVTTKVRTARQSFVNITTRALALAETSADSYTKKFRFEARRQRRQKQESEQRERSVQDVWKDHESATLGRIVSGGCFCTSYVDDTPGFVIT